MSVDELSINDYHKASCLIIFHFSLGSVVDVLHCRMNACVYIFGCVYKLFSYFISLSLQIGHHIDHAILQQNTIFESHSNSTFLYQVEDFYLPIVIFYIQKMVNVSNYHIFLQ